ncbi:ArnT family glycosyltransferase [Bacteroidota bacterium]
MKKKTQIFIWIVIFLLLLPILTFPISPDTSIYLESGKIIANGGKLYVDTIDLKQPLIYYIFSGIYLLIGYSEFSIRLFDFFWQSLTIISLFILVYKTNSKKIAYTAAIIYSISYTALNYTQTLQCESLAGLPLLWLIYFQVFKRRKPAFSLIRGMLIGFITGLKYTFGILLIPVLIDDFLNRTEKRNYTIRNVFALIGGFLLAFFITMSPLLDKNIFDGYLNVFKYLSFYSSVPVLNTDFLKMFLKDTAYFFGDRYSMLLTISAIAGFYYFMKKYAVSKNDKLIELLNISLLAIFFLFISVAVEGKFWDYHISRLYIPLIIISSVGIYFGLDKTFVFFRQANTYLKLIILTSLCIAFLFTPITRWANTVRKGYYYLTDTVKYDELYIDQLSENFIPLRKHYKIIAGMINENKSDEDSVIVITTGSNAINFFLNTENISVFRNSQYIFNPLNIPDWKIAFNTEIGNADWIVIQTDDTHSKVIHHHLSSWEAFRKEENIFKYFTQHFHKFKTVENFYIFRRNKE